jgi:hypothetical protein
MIPSLLPKDFKRPLMKFPRNLDMCLYWWSREGLPSPNTFNFWGRCQFYSRITTTKRQQRRCHNYSENIIQPIDCRRLGTHKDEKRTNLLFKLAETVRGYCCIGMTTILDHCSESSDSFGIFPRQYINSMNYPEIASLYGTIRYHEDFIIEHKLAVTPRE